MNIVGLDLVQVGTLVGSIGTTIVAVIKAVQATKKANQADARSVAIELAREQSKKDRDREIQELKTEVALLKVSKEATDKRLNEGNQHFVRLESEVKETNGLLREIIGALNNKGLIISGSPKAARDSRLEL